MIINRCFDTFSVRTLAIVIGALLSVEVNTAIAQTPPIPHVPNAGNLLQERNSQSRDFSSPGDIDKLDKAKSLSRSRRIHVDRVIFEGNTELSDEELAPLMRDVVGTEISESDLSRVVGIISSEYNARGHGFTFVSLDQAELRRGTIKFMIVEGKAGNINVSNGSGVRTSLIDGLMEDFREHPGDTDRLERAALLISDIPGVFGAHPKLTRGGGDGQVDVAMDIQPAPMLSGYASIDNFGSRTSGRTKLNATVAIGSPFGWGDVLRFNVSGLPFNMQSGDSTLGGASYDFPIANHGLRGGFGYNRMQYHLGGIYEGHFDGVADVLSAYVNYPIVRQKTRNLSVRLSYSHSLYRDNQVGFNNKRSSDTAVFSLYGNTQDFLFGAGAMNRFSFALTQGVLRFEDPLFAMQDALGSKTAGGYTKAEMTFSRMQQLTKSTYFQADVVSQYGFKNLDGSARMVMGGPFAIRAFSSDFVSVDSGMLLRTAAGWRPPLSLPVSVYAFYDFGFGALRHTPFPGQLNNVSLQGAGIGVDVTYRAISASVSWATRIAGNVPGIAQQPKSWLWATMAYSF